MVDFNAAGIVQTGFSQPQYSLESDYAAIQYGNSFELSMEAIATLKRGHAHRSAGEDQITRLELK